MKIKVSEAIGPALDWMVVVAKHGYDWRNPRHLKHFHALRNRHGLHQQARYSDDGRLTADIVEAGRICVNAFHDSKDWNAFTWSADGVRQFHMTGPTSAVAALRCYVVGKLGAEVDVPDELCQAEATTDVDAAPRRQRMGV